MVNRGLAAKRFHDLVNTSRYMRLSPNCTSKFRDTISEHKRPVYICTTVNFVQPSPPSFNIIYQITRG